jgi:hypothetical protein
MAKHRDWFTEQVDNAVQHIESEIYHGSFYGVFIEEDDPIDVKMAAAYWLGKNEGAEDLEKTTNKLLEILGK